MLEKFSMQQKCTQMTPEKLASLVNFGLRPGLNANMFETQNKNLFGWEMSSWDKP